MILSADQWGNAYDGTSTPLHRFTPVEVTVNANEDPLDFYWSVHDLAEDCINQGGVAHVRKIQPPQPRS
jgi:hypothetical protein